MEWQFELQPLSRRSRSPQWEGGGDIQQACAACHGPIKAGADAKVAAAAQQAVILQRQLVEVAAQEAETRNYAHGIELDMAQIEGQRQDMAAGLASAEARIAELELRVQSLRAQAGDAQHAAWRAEQRAEAAQAAQGEAQVAAQEASQRAHCLEGELAQSRAAGAALQAQLREQAGERRRDAAQAAARLLEAQQEAVSACHLLALAQHEHKARQAQLKLRVEEGEGAAARLEQQLEQQDGEAYQAHRVQQDQAATITVMQAKLDEQATLLADGEQERQGLMQDLLLATAKRSALEETAGGLRSELASLRSELAVQQQAAAAERGAASSAAQSLAQQCERQAVQVASQGSRLKGLQLQVVERDERCAELACQLAGRNEALDKLRHQLRDMNDLIVALRQAGGDQANSLERLEAQAASSAAEAASLRGEVSAKAAALQEHKAAEEMLVGRLQDTEARLRKVQGKHSELQDAHGVLRAAHAEQGNSWRQELALAQRRLSEVLATQEASAAAAAEARHLAEGLSSALGEQQALVERLRREAEQAQHEVATYKGRYQALQHANDSLRLQIMAGAGPAGTTGNKKATAAAPLLPSPLYGACPSPAIASGCRITAAHKAAAAAGPHSMPSLATQGSSPLHPGSPARATAIAAVHGLRGSPRGAGADGRPTSPSATSVCITAVTICHHDGELEQQV